MTWDGPLRVPASEFVPEHVWIAAGHGVYFWVWAEHHHLYYVHDCPLNGDAPGAIAFDVPENDYVPAEAKWQLESIEPLTISPSLLCPCGHHGFIRQGRWVPA